MQNISIFNVRNMLDFILAFIISIIFIFNTSFSAEAVTQSEIIKLEKGEIITESLTPQLKGNLKGGMGKILIKAPSQKVWNVLIAQENLIKTVPRLKKVEVLKKTENSQTVKAAIKVCPFLPTFKYIINIDQKEKYKKLRFDKVDGCFKELYGIWELEPYKNNTILTFKVYLDTGFYIPEFVRTGGLRKDLPEVLTQLKEEAEKPQ